MDNGVKLGSSCLWSKPNWVTHSHSSQNVYLIRKRNKFLFMVHSNGQGQQSLLHLGLPVSHPDVQSAYLPFMDRLCHKLWMTSTFCVHHASFSSRSAPPPAQSAPWLSSWKVQGILDRHVCSHVSSFLMSPQISGTILPGFVFFVAIAWGMPTMLVMSREQFEQMS